MSTADELRAIRSHLERALERVDQLISQGGQPALPALTDLPRTRAIEAVLAASSGPMRPIEVWKALQQAGRTDPKMEVQVTTFDLWERGRIDKVSRGLYVAKGAQGRG